MSSYIGPLQNSRTLVWRWSEHLAIWLASAFLVSVPVFFQAPLVRQAPWLSLILTVGWLALSKFLLEKPKSQIWGSLLWGFSLTWLCGSIYWGWLRWEPLWHLPIEAIALPWAIWAILPDQKNYRIGGWFYLGSLFGTAITDLYFYLTNLIPHWRSLMTIELDANLLHTVMQSAIAQIQTSWGISWGLSLIILLTTLGLSYLRSPNLHHWAFSGAVLSTLVVDAIFGIVAYLA